MDLVEVDVVEPEPLERRIDRRQHVLAGETSTVLARHRAPVHLRRDDVLLAHAEELLQQPAGDDLALTAVVDVGGVEERDPTLDRPPDDRVGGGLVERPGAALVEPVAHHAEADARDTKPGRAEVHDLHTSHATRRAALDADGSIV